MVPAPVNACDSVPPSVCVYMQVVSLGQLFAEANILRTAGRRGDRTGGAGSGTTAATAAGGVKTHARRRSRAVLI